MLRTIKTPQICPQIKLFTVALSSSGPRVVTINSGKGDGVGQVAAGDLGQVKMDMGYSRNLYNFFTGVSTSTGLVKVTAQATNLLTSPFDTLDSAAAVTPGTVNALVVGHNAVRDLTYEVGRNMGYAVKITRSGTPTLVCGSVASGVPSLSGTYQATVARPSTGTFDITFKRPGRQACVAFAVINSASAGKIDVSNQTASGFRVRTYNSSNVLTNLDFSFVAFTFTNSLVQAGQRRTLKSDQRKPRMMVTSFTGGVSPAIDGGGKDFNVSRTSTGVYAVTFTEPYLRAPIILAQPLAAASIVRAQVTSVSALGATIRVFNNSSVATDPDRIHLFSLGSDSLLTY